MCRQGRFDLRYILIFCQLRDLHSADMYTSETPPHKIYSVASAGQWNTEFYLPIVTYTGSEGLRHYREDVTDGRKCNINLRSLFPWSSPWAPIVALALGNRRHSLLVIQRIIHNVVSIGRRPGALTGTFR